MSEFQSAWLKWGWAVIHAQALDADIEGVALDTHREPFGTLAAEYDPKRHGFSITVSSAVPIPARWNLMLGDVVGNFRACLDHLAWALVRRGHTPNLRKDKESRVYFPIADSRSHFNATLTRKLPGVRRADLAIIRRYQPYVRGKTRVRWHCLTLLDGMVKSDKHREIQGLWMVPDRAEYKVLNARDCIVTRHAIKARRRTLQIGTEVAYIGVRKLGPEPDLQVQYELTTYPAFHERLWLQHWMEITTIQTMLLLGEFAECPSDIDALGIDATRFAGAKERWRANAAAWVATAGRGTPVL